MPRGGSRQGKAGAAYSNRTDLVSKPRLPVTTVPNQPYGAAGAQQAAQQTVPMGSPPVPSGAPTEEPQYAAPDDVMGLHEPTGRPDEHIMTGVNAGPGPGSEILPTGAPDPVLKGLSILNVLGDRLPPELKQVQAYLAAAQNNQIRP